LTRRVYLASFPKIRLEELSSRSPQTSFACACCRPLHDQERAVGDRVPRQASAPPQHRCVPCGSEGTYGLRKRQYIKGDLIGQFTPVGGPRRDQHARPSGRQKVRYRIWRGNVVENEKPCRALLRQSAQSSLRRLLNISFFCRCRTQRHGEARESIQEPCARFSRTPTNARIQPPEAVRIRNGQRSLTHAAHALHRSATDRRLRDRQRACPASGWRRADQARLCGL